MATESVVEESGESKEGITVRTEEDIRDELAEVRASRLILVNRSLRLKVFMLRPFSGFLEPLLQFAHFMGQRAMADWILDGPDAPSGLIDGHAQQELLRKEAEKEVK